MNKVSKIKNIINFTDCLVNKGVFQSPDNYDSIITKAYYNINEIEKVEFLLKERISEIYDRKNHDSANARDLLDLLLYTKDMALGDTQKEKAKKLFLDFISLGIINNPDFFDYLAYGCTELAYDKLDWDTKDKSRDSKERYRIKIHRYNSFVTNKQNPLLAFNTFKEKIGHYGDILDNIVCLTQICSSSNNIYNKDDFAFKVINYHEKLLSKEVIQNVGVFKSVVSLCKIANFYLSIKNYVEEGDYTSLDAFKDVKSLLIKAEKICDKMSNHADEKYKYYSLISYYHYLNDDNSSAEKLICEVIEHDILTIEKNEYFDIRTNYIRIFENIKIAQRLGATIATEKLVIKILELTIIQDFNYSSTFQSGDTRYKEKIDIDWKNLGGHLSNPTRINVESSYYDLVEQIYDYCEINYSPMLIERLIQYLELLKKNNPLISCKKNNPRITLLLAKCYIFTDRINDGVKAMNSIVSIPYDPSKYVANFNLTDNVLAERIIDLQITLDLSDEDFFKNPNFSFVPKYKFEYYLRNKDYLSALKLIEIEPLILNEDVYSLMRLTEVMCKNKVENSSELINTMKKIANNLIK